MGGEKRKKGSRCCGLTSPAKILQTVFFFLDRWFEVQNEGTEGSFRANVGDSLLFPGCMRRGGGVGGWPGLQR